MAKKKTLPKLVIETNKKGNFDLELKGNKVEVAEMIIEIMSHEEDLFHLLKGCVEIYEEHKPINPND